ncbi:hypothetical protein Ancab_035415 [Ancistrocladus abbreviatus]
MSFADVVCKMSTNQGELHLLAAEVKNLEFQIEQQGLDWLKGSLVSRMHNMEVIPTLQQRMKDARIPWCNPVANSSFETVKEGNPTPANTISSMKLVGKSSRDSIDTTHTRETMKEVGVKHGQVAAISSPNTVEEENLAPKYAKMLMRLTIHSNLDAVHMWEVGKKLGTAFSGNETEVIDQIKKMELRDSRAWEKLKYIKTRARAEEGYVSQK